MFKILAVSLFALLAAPMMQAYADSSPNRTITVNGHGEIKAAPDTAVVELGVFSQGNTAKAALEQNTKNMAALMDVLKAAGIDPKDIQTSNFNVGPRYDNSGKQPPKVVGYDVNNSVSVTVRKLDELGTLLDQAVSSGSNQINGLNFTVDDPQKLQDEARENAVKDAKRKAALMAGAADAKLGPVITIKDGGGPQPYPMSRGMSPMVADAMVAKAAPVPVAQGQMLISSDVSVVWELSAQ